MDSLDLIHPKIKEQVKKVISVPYVFPKDIMRKIMKDEEIWNNFQKFSETYKRIRVAYIDEARDRPAEFKKRLNNFLKKTKENKIITGYGGTDKYYKIC